jgi:hypothetical protein
MDKKWVIAAGCVGIAFAVAVAQQGRPSAPPLSQSPHYQLFAAKAQPYGDGAPVDEVFLLDTQTGCVWRYESGGGTKIRIPDQFTSILVTDTPGPDLQTDLAYRSGTCKSRAARCGFGGEPRIGSVQLAARISSRTILRSVSSSLGALPSTCCRSASLISV